MKESFKVHVPSVYLKKLPQTGTCLRIGTILELLGSNRYRYQLFRSQKCLHELINVLGLNNPKKRFQRNQTSRSNKAVGAEIC